MCLTNRISLFGGLIIFAYLCYKAATVQLTHDEVYTVMQLTPQPVWDLISYKSSYTNNHILNTLLCKLSCNLFEMNTLSGRLPILISFIFYFYYCLKLSEIAFKGDEKRWYRWAMLSVLVCNPYLLDFFSLARGYGIAIACMMGAIYHSTQYVCFKIQKSLPFALFWAMMAVYAQFGLLHFWLGFQANLLIYNVLANSENRKSILWTQIFFVVLTILFIYFPIIAIVRDNQIAYYGTKGFLEDTINSIIKNSLFAQSYFDPRNFDVFVGLMVILFALVLINNGLKIKKLKIQAFTTPNYWLFGLLLMSAMSVILQFHLLGNQYVIDRTALFFYPLLAMNFAFAGETLSLFKPIAGRALLITLISFSVYHTLRSSNLRNYREWYYDIHTFEVLDFMEQERAKRLLNGDTVPIRLDMSWIFQPSIAFYWKTRHYSKWMNSPPFHMDIQGNTDCEFYYASADDVPKLLEKFEIVLKFPDNVGQLMRKKTN
jgi:hypothetical protein